VALYEVIPKELLTPEKISEVILYLWTLPIPLRIKKIILTDWAHYTGYVLTQAEYDKLLHPFLPYLRG